MTHATENGGKNNLMKGFRVNKQFYILNCCAGWRGTYVGTTRYGRSFDAEEEKFSPFISVGTSGFEYTMAAYERI